MSTSFQNSIYNKMLVCNLYIYYIMKYMPYSMNKCDTKRTVPTSAYSMGMQSMLSQSNITPAVPARIIHQIGCSSLNVIK